MDLRTKLTTTKSVENISEDIPITSSDREVLLAIGKIKRQKQRPSVDRLFNILKWNKVKDKFPDFCTKDGIESVLNDMISRHLLQKVDNEKGLISYRELNSAIPIVAITNPKRSRAKAMRAEDMIANRHKPDVCEKKDPNEVFVSQKPNENYIFKKTLENTRLTRFANYGKLESHSLKSRKKMVKKMVNTRNSSIMSIEESISTVVANTYLIEPSDEPSNEPSKPSAEPSLATVMSSKPSTRETMPFSTVKENEKVGNSCVVTSLESSVCGMCGKRGGDDSQSNELIKCSMCGMSGHAHCLGCSLQLLKRIKECDHWECPNCKKCPICGICGTHDDELIICSLCDRGFHRQCIQLSNTYSDPKWICKTCKPSKTSVSLLTNAKQVKPITRVTKFKNIKKSAEQLKAVKILDQRMGSKRRLKLEENRKRISKLFKQVMDQKYNSIQLNEMNECVSSIKTIEKNTSIVETKDIISSSAHSLPSHSSTKLFKNAINQNDSVLSEEQLCVVCGLNDKDLQSNQLISCSICLICVHIKCIECSQQFIERIQRFPYWECNDCKKCPICGSHDDQLIVCNYCDRGFHRICIQNSDENKPINWIDCQNCNPNLINAIQSKPSIDSQLMSIEITPIEDYSNEDLKSIIKRALLETPNDYEDDYRQKLIKVIKRESPKILH